MGYMFFKIIIIISFIAIFCISDVSMADKKGDFTMDFDLQVVVNPSKNQYLLGENLQLDVKLYNKGKKDIVLEGPLLPEGLKVRLSIKKPDGYPIYNSPSIKIEPKGKFYYEIYLQPFHFFGVHFEIAAKIKNKIRFPVGKYKILAIYQNASKGIKKNITTGLWRSKEVSITILETDGKK